MPGNLDSEDNISLEYDGEGSKSKEARDGIPIEGSTHEPHERPIAGHQARRSIVDELLTEIYSHRRYSGPYRRRLSSTPEESDHSTSPDSSSGPLPTNRRRFTDATLRSNGIQTLRMIKGQLQQQVKDVLSILVRQLTRRDHLLSKRDRQYDFLTAILQAASPKRGVDTRMKFSVEPRGGDTGFMQWHDAMKMVARLPGGIPADFRKRLWLTMADKHLQTRRVDWNQAKRVCFNERSNPDDDELGTQIVKDLHRTGCSLFCGDEAEHNQALLKRVLLAYARWNKMVGYCQGFNMLAALILEVTEWCEENALKVMIYLIEGVLPESYFANSLRGLSVDMAVFRDLLRLRLPNLSRHLDTLQAEARESASGASYEPPLTNVFTMQWFLTLFSNCLPKSTVLRVWDLIFLEGNEVLLRTALAIWDGIADRIMAVESADEFYSIMHVLTREMLEFGLMDANYLVKTICMMAPFPFPQLAELRDKYTYNITPFTAALGLAKRAGFRLLHSDDEEEEDEQQMAVAAWCFSSVLPHQVAAIKAKGEARERSASIASTSSSSSVHGANFTVLGPGALGPSPPGYSSSPPAQHHADSDRMTLDISALKKQYAKLRERQKQAHIILTAARLPPPAPNRPPSIAVNHLLVGKKPLTSKRGQMQKGTIHLVMQNKPTGRSNVARKASSPPHHESGETLQWKEAKEAKRRASLQHIDLTRIRPNRKDKMEEVVSSSSSSSSSSTELCDDDQGTLSDFDSDEEVMNDSTKVIPPGSPKDVRSPVLEPTTETKPVQPPATMNLLSVNNNEDYKQWNHLSPLSPLSATSSGLTSGPDQMSLSSSENDLKSEEFSIKQVDNSIENDHKEETTVDVKDETENTKSNAKTTYQDLDVSLGEKCSSLVDNWLKTKDSFLFSKDNDDDKIVEESITTTKVVDFVKDISSKLIPERNDDESKSVASDEAQSFYSMSGSHTGSSYMYEEDRVSNPAGSVDDFKEESEDNSHLLQDIQSYWVKKYDEENLDLKDSEEPRASCDKRVVAASSIDSTESVSETNSDERFKKYILESSSKFLEQGITSNKCIKRNGFSTDAYKWTEVNDNEALSDGEKRCSSLPSGSLVETCVGEESLETSLRREGNDPANSKRMIPRRMSCTDLPEANAFSNESTFDWLLKKITERESDKEQNSSRKLSFDASELSEKFSFLKDSLLGDKPKHYESVDENMFSKQTNCVTHKMRNLERDSSETRLSSDSVKKEKTEHYHLEERDRDSTLFDSSSREISPTRDGSGKDHLSEIASICSQMQRSFGSGLPEGSSTSPSFSHQYTSVTSSSSSAEPQESEDWLTRTSTTTSSHSATSNSINNLHPDANCETNPARNLVGNISLRTSVTPITFNPFPTSRKSPSKLPTDIGVKLGLYESNNTKTEKTLNSPSKGSSSPTKKKFYW